MQANTVLFKTDAGLDEMQKRQAGLSPRVRQLLILVDGKRSVAELRKMVAGPELDEQLALLELKGLVAKRGEPVPTVEPLAAPKPAPVGALASAVMGQSTHEQRGGNVQVAEFSELDFADSAIMDSDFETFKRDRLMLAKVLCDSVGPMGDELALRIEKASKRSELNELYVAALTIVELMTGHKAVDRFVEKLRQLGWEPE